MSGFVIKQIRDIANQLRDRNTSLYGEKGTQPGMPDYVKDGFKNAIRDAAKEYYQLTGKTASQATVQRTGSVAQRLKSNSQEDALYWGYKLALIKLKTEYHNSGLLVVRPPKPRNRQGVLSLMKGRDFLQLYCN